ncbi:MULTISPECIES: DUF397 domain-containing protein [unclassified Streptomyces]|uniref:DUF397 domain-containing protein n=1 Tax=unclassified Streptomyces TaxID=2593676 RepID=UPI00093D9800|nr:DUF397 domain-containing protein [Streptomyces sp. CB01580]OKJ41495.1 hypothetical protein AMK22_08385 [Streptomyces sp. CB01580]
MKHQEIVTAFKKASASQSAGQDCVEVAQTADGGRAVRDSKNPDGGLQFYAPAGWAAFIDGVKADAFSG